MSNTNGQATVTTEGADDVQHSSESTKYLGERTLTDMQMEEDNDQGENMGNGSPTTSINRELIAISETDMLSIPWNDLRQIAKMRILEVFILYLPLIILHRSTNVHLFSRLPGKIY